MHTAGLDQKVCSICLAVGAEFYMFQNKFKWLLEMIYNKMSLEISENSYTCCECLNELVTLNYFKSLWSENEEKLRIKVLHESRKIHISELVYPNSTDKFDITNICRLCLTVIDENSASDLLTTVDDIPLAEMFPFSLPDVLLDLTYHPMFCIICAVKVKDLYIFIKKCVETEEKIKTYLENTGITLRKTNRVYFLFNVLKYFQDVANKVQKPSSINYFFCDRCEYKTIREAALRNHKQIIHPVECILGSSTDTETEPDTPADNVNGGESSIAPDNIVNSEISSKHSTADDTASKKRIFDGTSTQVNIAATKISKCTDCNIYETSTNCNFKLHVVGHNNVTQMYHCLFCDFKTNYQVDLTSHNLEHKPKNCHFLCHKCAYFTDRLHNLTKHLARHKQMEEKWAESNEIFLCPECPFTAKVMEQLNSHIIATHKKDIPHTSTC